MHSSPVELPTGYSGGSQPLSNRPPYRARVNSGDNYYEDVDPRFVDSDPTTESSGVLPASLTPGGASHSNTQLQPSNSYEDIQEGSRSPAASEASNFTSVSQRGVNPHWGPPAPDMNTYPRKPVQPQQRRDVLLGNNPDFELPGGNRGRGGGPGREGRMPGQIPGMGVGPGGMPAPGGRYPGPHI